MKKGYKSVTMQDIADKLQVSKNAVSLALSNKFGVSEELREQILKTANEMGYKHSSKLQSEVKKDILILVPEYISNDKFFYYEIYWEIERVARENNIEAVRVTITKEDEVNLTMIENINDSYEGIIAIGVFERNYAEKLVDTVDNVVFLDNYYYGLEADYILTANIDATVELVKYLVTKGHSDIGFVGSIDVTSSLYDRWIGFVKGMRINNLEVDKEKCITPISELESLLNKSEEIKPFIEKIHYDKKMPSAWVTGNDRVAYALINVLRELGYDVPHDVSVVGFDDIEFSELFNPPLTTARVPRETLAKEAVLILIEKNKCEKSVKKREYFTKIIERNSVSTLI